MIKNLRYYMDMSFSKDPQVRERIAEAMLKAGMPGELNGYYKISHENRLTGAEIRDVFFGQKVTGFNLLTEKQWWIERSGDGEAIIIGGEGSDSGKSWVEDDMLCDQWGTLFEGLKDCWPIYRNPEGSRQKNDEYLGVPGYEIYPFSPMD